jgi:hypothetical protein
MASNSMSCKQIKDLPIRIVLMCAEYPIIWDIGNAFIEYFQMSETTSRICLSCLMRCIVCFSALADVYLRKLKSPMLEVLLHCTIVSTTFLIWWILWMFLKSTGKIAYCMEGTVPRWWEVCQNRIRSCCWHQFVFLAWGLWFPWNTQWY